MSALFIEKTLQFAIENADFLEWERVQTLKWIEQLGQKEANHSTVKTNVKIKIGSAVKTQNTWRFENDSWVNETVIYLVEKDQTEMQLDLIHEWIHALNPVKLDLRISKEKFIQEKLFGAHGEKRALHIECEILPKLMKDQPIENQNHLLKKRGCLEIDEILSGKGRFVTENGLGYPENFERQYFQIEKLRSNLMQISRKEDSKINQIQVQN